MVLSASHVTRQFIRKRGGGSNIIRAVDDLSVELEGGKITVITGPSGSGKSTLLNMLAGILAPTEGTVKIGDIDLYGLDDETQSAFRNEHIGVIPQGQTLIHSLSVTENVLLPYRLYESRRGGGAARRKREVSSGAGASGTQASGVMEDRRPEHETEAAARAGALLARTGIQELGDEMPSELSGGEMRRCAIVRAMLMKPDVILADEPTADLDEENTATVLELLRYAAEEGSSVLIVTHDRDVFPAADRVLRLRAGKIEAE